MVSGIEFKDISINNLSHKKALECAELYCQIWKEPPWLEDFWKSSEVLADMKKQLNKDESICVFAEEANSHVVGFTWGYVVSQEDIRDICGNNSLDFIFNGGRVFYVDELGVSASYRNCGIGKSLTKKLISLAKEKLIKTAILRTNVLAESARIVYKEMGFVDLKIFDKKYSDRTYWLAELK
jgi:ribosomal protein S18 acetylase RimI-like enzyme